MGLFLVPDRQKERLPRAEDHGRAEDASAVTAGSVRDGERTPPCSKNGSFVPYFQPLVDLRTGELVAVEMLARCNHPTGAVLLPEQFIPHAEEGGWIGHLMRTLTTRAIVELQCMVPRPHLSLNVSPLQLRDRQLPRQIEGIAKRTGYPLPCLTLEITESAMAADQACALAVARDLKAMGCRLSLDDFGTGYSSLLHLQALPFDELKVDRQFVSSMLERRESRKIVSAVIGLGQSLGLQTVAEGVENREQSEMLRWLGCDLGQGWLYGRPMPAEQLREFTLCPLASASSKLILGSESSLEHPATRLAQLQAVYDGAPVGLAFLNRDLRYLNLNHRMAQMNGFSVQQHLGRTIGEMLPHLFPAVSPYLQRALKGEVIHDVELRVEAHGEDDSYIRWFSYQPALDEAGEVVGICVAVLNFDKSRRVQALSTDIESRSA